MKYVLIAWAVIAAIFIAGLSQIQMGKEPLTELYFEEHVLLPLSLRAGNTSSFTFTIHNLEYMNVAYTYQVSENHAGNITLLGTETITIPSTQSKSVAFPFSLPLNFSRSRIEVALIGRSERIGFWVDEDKANAQQSLIN